MIIRDARLTFVLTETLAAPLAALAAPEIPDGFLLSDALFQLEVGKIAAGTSALRLPWHDGSGKLFWFHYLEEKHPLSAKPADVWGHLVPLESDVTGQVGAAWVPGTITIRGYLYPWGITTVVDIQIAGAWPLVDFVDLAFNIRRTGKYDWTLNGETISITLNPLLERASSEVRARAYGATTQTGQLSEVFSIVTVLNADDVDAAQVVDVASDTNRAIVALAAWGKYWKSIDLKDSAVNRLATKPSVTLPGHVLYADRRGRTVWFPGAFASAPASGGIQIGLTCYHQNLLASAFQTESLCGFARAVAAQLPGGQSFGQYSVTYGNCARTAAGILGRLYGGKQTYRSHSVRHQIKTTYEADVNAVRAACPKPMPPLA